MLASVKIEWIREASLKLLGGCCASCGDTDIDSLHIHHIIPLKTPSGRGQDRRAWEGLRLAVHQEGLILCPYCHGMLHSNDKMLWLQDDKPSFAKEMAIAKFAAAANGLWKGQKLIYQERGG